MGGDVDSTAVIGSEDRKNNLPIRVGGKVSPRLLIHCQRHLVPCCKLLEELIERLRPSAETL